MVFHIRIRIKYHRRVKIGITDRRTFLGKIKFCCGTARRKKFLKTIFFGLGRECVVVPFRSCGQTKKKGRNAYAHVPITLPYRSFSCSHEVPSRFRACSPSPPPPLLLLCSCCWLLLCSPSFVASLFASCAAPHHRLPPDPSLLFSCFLCSSPPPPPPKPPHSSSLGWIRSGSCVLFVIGFWVAAFVTEKLLTEVLWLEALLLHILLPTHTRARTHRYRLWQT